MDLNAALEDLGQFGWFQVYYLTLLFFPMALTSFRVTEYVFTTMNIPHRCRITRCDPEGPAPFSPPWLPHAVPLGEHNFPSACLRYGGTPGYNSSCDVAMFTNSTEICDSWVFSEPTVTIARDFNILCAGDFWKLTFLSSISVFTGLIGEPLSGLICDRFGRKTVVTYGCVYICMAGLVRSFSPSYVILALIEGLDGFVCGALFCPVVVLALESLSVQKRVLGNMLINIYWPIGELFLVFIMWLFKDWRNLLRVFYAPMLVISVLLCWFLPESVRWLHVRGKREELKKAFSKIAKLNNTEGCISTITTQLDVFETIDKCASKSADQSLPLLAVLKSPILLGRVAVCSLFWITNIFSTSSINQSAAYFGDDQYLSFLLVVLIEFPATLVSLWMPNWSWLGRKFTLFWSFGVPGVSCLVMIFVPSDKVALNMTLYLTGKFFCTVQCPIVILYAAELFPTHLRQSLIAFCSTCGRVGFIVSQQTPLMTPYVNPMLVVSMVSLAAAALSLACPETLGSALPDTMEEAEAIGRGVAPHRSTVNVH